MDSQDRITLADAAVALLSEQGMRALSYEAVEQRAGLAAGSARAAYPQLDALILAINDRLVAHETGVWLRLGPLAPQSIEDIAERFVQYTQIQVSDCAAQVRARVELMLAYPAVLRIGHLALFEMVTVVLDRIGVPEPAARADMLISIVDGTIIRFSSVCQDDPLDVVALHRAIKRILT